jgi:iron complex outermembrane receptor protein
MAFLGKSQSSLFGKIITQDGSPAANVNIELKELKKYTTSDLNGAFSFNPIADGRYTLIASYIGLQTKQQQVIIPQDKASQLNIVLSENASELQEVIINSKKGLNNQLVLIGKVSIDPMDLPQSISVMGQSVIRDQQSQRLSDVIKNVNGVYLSSTRANTQESFSARGYGFSSSNMFKNGSRINTGTMPEVSSLEKVEILKGSAAILYGNVAPGAIINMVTKQPKFFYGGEIALRAGSYGLLKPSFDIFGPLSKKIAFRVNGTVEKANSFRNTVQSNRYYINPSLLFKIGKKTILIAQGDHLNHDFTPDFGIGTLNNTVIPDVPRSNFVGTQWQYNKAKQTTVTVTLKHELNNNWTVNASASYQLYSRDYYSTERIQAAANGDWIRPLNKIESQEKYFVGNIDLVGKFKTGAVAHHLLTGLDGDKYFTSTYAFNNPIVYDTVNILNPTKFIARTDIPSASKITRLETPINRLGAYVQDLINISNQLKLLVGMRWSIQKGLPATTTYLLKDSAHKGNATTANAFSPRLGLVYKPFESMSTFASYSNSFSVNSGTDVSGNALSPSLIDQFEFGMKNNFIKDKLSANLTFYKIINNNLAQTAQFTADGITPNNNIALKELAGQTTSNGIELDINAQLVKGLNILAGYSFNNMRYTKTKEAKGNYIEGEKLINTPTHTANTSAFYTFNKGALKGLKLGIAGFYTGDRLGGWNNTQGQTQNYNRLFPVIGFTTFDLSAGHSYKKITLLVKLSNLMNTYNYYVHENYSINPIAPRQIISTLSVKF